ncbi:isoprenoid synthase domain-containing protein [Mycena olivaceomarginata]|nr:isoprenoid synthase domain-containing protein [Mycena olivaceomarginata]
MAVSFTLPDLLLICDFPLRMNRYRKQVAAETIRWILHGTSDTELTHKVRGLKCGLLAAMYYPQAGFPQLRVCNDFLTFLFHIDDISDVMDSLGAKETGDGIADYLRNPSSASTCSKEQKVAKDYFKRLALTTSKDTQDRFMHSLEAFFEGLEKQAKDRLVGKVPSFDTYIDLRGDTSGCRPCFVLIEYANNLRLPSRIMKDAIIQQLGDYANDLVAWSNDLFSFKVETKRKDTHNIVCVMMHEHGIDLQLAVNMVGKLCSDRMEDFIRLRAQLPSWGPTIDGMVRVYVDGLQDWMVGSLHWSFKTERYFGESSKAVLETLKVEL